MNIMFYSLFLVFPNFFVHTVAPSLCQRYIHHGSHSTTNPTQSKNRSSVSPSGHQRDLSPEYYHFPSAPFNDKS
uniref:Secreted protein n=1 Tax=Oryzias melastigma TaxID=30732 RepID=A0A3B3CU71_ORYME